MMQELVDQWHHHPVVYSTLALATVLFVLFLVAAVLVMLNDVITYVRSLS